MFSTFGFVLYQKSSTVVWKVFVYVEFAMFKHLHCTAPAKQYDRWRIEVGHYVEKVLSIYHELNREKTESLH